LISTWSARDYAELRVSEHHNNFNRLCDMAERYGKKEWVNPGEWTFLGDCEAKDKLFEDITLKWFAKVEYPAR
jgi:1,4-alpha-glucan branching enzyme